MGALFSLFLITEKALSLLGVAIILFYIAVPKSGAQSVIKLGISCSNMYWMVLGAYDSGVITE